MQQGQKVKTSPSSWNGAGTVVSRNSQSLITNRRHGRGTVLGWVPGYGGDLWYVAHGKGTNIQAVYLISELS